MSQTMNAKDAISGSLAECFITIDGNRYNFMQLYEFESKYELNIIDVPILGQTSKGHKAVGASGTWKGTAHFNQSLFREILYKFKQTGEMVYFDIQVTNSDKTSSVGNQTVILKNCLIEGGILAKFNASNEVLNEEVSGTFDDWELPQKFTLLNGMV